MPKDCLSCQLHPPLDGWVVCRLCRLLAASNRGCSIGVLGRVFGRLKVAESGCWEYQGYLTEAGYAGNVQRDDGRLQSAYRVILENKEPQPGPEFEADHICWNRKCCNPDHLQWLTPQENVRRRKTGLKTPEEKRVKWNAYISQYRKANRQKWNEIQKRSRVKRRQATEGLASAEVP